MRQLNSWIDSFMEYTAAAGTSPEIFRRWGAIMTIAGALERKVWATTMGKPQYPHLYVLIIAPPGVGKTFVTSEVFDFWRILKEHKIASSSVNSASLMDDLRDSQRNIVLPGKPAMQFNSLKICSNELEVFIPTYDPAFMGKLTDLFDCRPYSERRRKEENSFTLESPQLNLFAATTPKFINSMMPEGAWDQGFMSRVIMIFSGQQTKKSLFGVNGHNAKLRKQLEQDLQHIARLIGEYRFMDEAANDLDAWWMADGPPIPDHPRLFNYRTRRHVFLTKLMIVSAAARHDEPILDKVDFDNALTWLLEAEMHMPEVFKAMSSSGDGKIIEDLHHSMFAQFLKNGRQPFPHKFVYRYLQKRLPGYVVENAIDGMVQGGLLKKVQVDGQGKCYEPLPLQGGAF